MVVVVGGGLQEAQLFRRRLTAERGRLISCRRNRLSSACLEEGVKEPVTLCPPENLNMPENMPVNSNNAAPQQRPGGSVVLVPLPWLLRSCQEGFIFSLSL